MAQKRKVPATRDRDRSALPERQSYTLTDEEFAAAGGIGPEQLPEWFDIETMTIVHVQAQQKAVPVPTVEVWRPEEDGGPYFDRKHAAPQLPPPPKDSPFVLMRAAERVGAEPLTVAWPSRFTPDFTARPKL